MGEIDLVCMDGETLVIVEVRLREKSALVGPIDSVDRRKQKRMTLATKHLVAKHPEFHSRPIRFDVVGITCDGNSHEIEWVVSAFP